MKPGEDYYTICKVVGNGIFSNERIISFPHGGRDLMVDVSSLAITSDGFVSTRFHLMSLESGMGTGLLYNCENEMVRYSCLLDSISLSSKVTSFVH